jgi:hypothetical protein
MKKIWVNINNFLIEMLNFTIIILLLLNYSFEYEASNEEYCHQLEFKTFCIEDDCCKWDTV